MTYTYLVSAKKRTTLQKVFAGFMVLSLNLSMGGAMAFVAPSVASAVVTPVTFFSDSFGTGSGNTVPGWTEAESNPTYAKTSEGNERASSPTKSHARLNSDASITRTFSTAGYQNIHLKYFWNGDNDAEDSDKLKVYWKLSSASTFALLAEHPGDVTTWSNEQDHTLPTSANNGSIVIRFVGVSSQSQEEFRIDDISLIGTTIVVDTDGDGIADSSDNCPSVSNSSQVNTDGDAQGDACDTDDDNDGVSDTTDNCVLTPNQSQVNTDGDAQGDACDTDDDNDTVLDASDNCVLNANTDQKNTDTDSMGDVCDTDDDNDEVLDTTDNCPLVSNSNQLDSDSDGVGNSCDETPFPAPVCGNEIQEAGEQCDDANQNNNDSCTNTCQMAYCGDGIVKTSSEQCDDGNEVNNDSCTNACTFYVAPPTACEENISTLTVVSDATNNVVETAAPAIGTWVHSAWTNIVGSTWIWGTPEVLAPTTQETETFTKTFSVTGTVTGASLELAADNDYVVWVNGTQVASSTPEAAGNNFGSVTTVTVPTALFVQGANEIKMQVTNLAYNGDSHANPAGALYKLTVTKNACIPTPAPVCDPEVNLLSNGDFEAPVVSGWDIIPFTNSALKWLGAFVAPQNGGRLGLELQASVAGSPFAGVQHAELDGDHPVKIWQNVPLMPGYDYELSTMYSPRPGSNAADNTLQFQLNGVALGANVARDGSTNANTVWTKESRTFTAGAASADVGFAEVGTDSSIGVFLDNASLRCVQKHVPAATIVATKVVCDNESDLPNWSGTGQVIDANTATSYVSQKEGACRIVPDWKFQWAPTSANNPGDNTGEAADWHTFVSSVSVALGDMTSVWMREVYDAAYIPFTHSTTQSNVSAEMYCNGDVLNYDNLDYARNLTDGGTVYCVAFNVLKDNGGPTDTDMDDDGIVDEEDNCPSVANPDQSDRDDDGKGDVCDDTMITVIKHVVNDNGGTMHAGDFSIRVNVPEEEEEEYTLVDQVKDFFSTKTAFAGMMKLYAGDDFPGNEEGTDVYFKGPTEFNVVEAPHAHYTVSYSEGCRGAIKQGEHLTCVVTNDDKAQGGGGGTGSTDTPYPGCMNPEATNFNRLANRDDGSCQFPQSQQPTGGETAPQGEVLGAATTEPDLSLPASCGEYLSDYLRYGKKNNPEQVKLLQSFLNEYVEANLPVTGFFGKMTHNAVKKFQVKYHSEIIKPWIDAGYKDKDIENGTGYVFKTTKREINLLKCSSLNIPMPELKAE